MIDLALVEVELKKKLKYNYQWEKIQNDDGDSKTKFIYRSYKRDDLVQTVKRVWEEDTTISKTSLFNYATNRRYNFWSAQCVEEIFKQHINVSPTNDSYDKYKDFFIAGIPFDHKTSVFPGRYPRSIDYAVHNKNDLIQWLYQNQSHQQRFHMKNRLFVVVYSHSGQHRKLKSEINTIKDYIDTYLSEFSVEKLYSFNIETEEILSDIIFVVQ